MDHTLLVYGPTLTSEQIERIVGDAVKSSSTTVYLQEIDVVRLDPSLRSGMLASLPFAGLMEDQLVLLRRRAEALGCQHFTFALPAGWIRDGQFDQVRSLLASIQEGATLKLVVTIVMAGMSGERLQDTIRLCFSAGIERICLGTGTKLDSVTDDAIAIALQCYTAEGRNSKHLEVAVDTRRSLDDRFTSRFCISDAVQPSSAY
jgi:deoxyribose-phosphate aldolase